MPRGPALSPEMKGQSRKTPKAPGFMVLAFLDLGFRVVFR